VVAAKEKKKMHSVIHRLNPALSLTCSSPAAQEFLDLSSLKSYKLTLLVRSAI